MYIAYNQSLPSTGLFPQDLVVLYADGVEVPDELRGDGYLELLGVELDAVAGLGILEIEREGDIALVMLHNAHKVLTELVREHCGSDIH